MNHKNRWFIFLRFIARDSTITDRNSSRSREHQQLSNMMNLLFISVNGHFTYFIAFTLIFIIFLFEPIHNLLSLSIKRINLYLEAIEVYRWRSCNSRCSQVDKWNWKKFQKRTALGQSYAGIRQTRFPFWDKAAKKQTNAGMIWWTNINVHLNTDPSGYKSWRNGWFFTTHDQVTDAMFSVDNKCKLRVRHFWTFSIICET